VNFSSRGRPRRRRSRRRRQLRRIRISVATTLLGLLIAGWLIFSERHHSSYESIASDLPSVPAANPAPDYAALAARISVPKQARIHHYPIFSYSVVRGGVHSLEELQQAIAHDHAVAEHYAGFQLKRARLVRLNKPALVYLSYRMNGKIFWTSAPHRLNPGEELITDGTISARTKCANQVSARKQLAVSPEEPPAAALEEVEPPPVLPPAQTGFPVLYKEALLTPAPTPWSGPSRGPIFPIFAAPLAPPLVHHKPICESTAEDSREAKLGLPDDESKEIDCKPRRKPPAAVPEPGTWLFMGTGLAGLAAMYWKRQSYNAGLP
jgi:PEP-CTERM motif